MRSRSVYGEPLTVRETVVASTTIGGSRRRFHQPTSAMRSASWDGTCSELRWAMQLDDGDVHRFRYQTN